MSELKAPPVKPEVWVMVPNTGGQSAAFVAKTWFKARQEASAQFRCEPSDVVCVGRPV